MNLHVWYLYGRFASGSIFSLPHTVAPLRGYAKGLFKRPVSRDSGKYLTRPQARAGKRW